MKRHTSFLLCLLAFVLILSGCKKKPETIPTSQPTQATIQPTQPTIQPTQPTIQPTQPTEETAEATTSPTEDLDELPPIVVG